MISIRLSQRQKAALAIAIAVVMWIPTGISHDGGTYMVTGHSTFYNGAGYDPCLGSIVGIMRDRVMWFNDQVLVETYGGKGTFIYATEEGAPDPRKSTSLFTEGTFYDLVDPNGAHWHIEEDFYNVSVQATEGVDGLGSSSPRPWVSTTQGDRTYVWIVELSARPIYDDFAGADPHTFYNFLTIADTCKMHNSTATYAGEAQHNADCGCLDDRHGHPNHELEHHHAVFNVSLWVGGRPPAAIPVGASANSTQFETEWASGEANSAAPDSPGSPVPGGT